MTSEGDPNLLLDAKTRFWPEPARQAAMALMPMTPMQIMKLTIKDVLK